MKYYATLNVTYMVNKGTPTFSIVLWGCKEIITRTDSPHSTQMMGVHSWADTYNVCMHKWARMPKCFWELVAKESFTTEIPPNPT